MTSATQLINYVINNDYETIEKLIQSKKKLQWDCQDRKGHNILYRAVETRAKECFDLLIDNELVNRKSEALNKAIDYYSSAPNPINEHYLLKLLNTDIDIGLYNISKFFDYPVMFNRIFSKIDKNKDNIGWILKDSIRECKPVIYEQIFNMLEEIKPDYWIQTNSMAQEIFKCGIENNNIDVIDFVKDKIDWKIVETKPSIYYALKKFNYTSFNYLFGLFESLPKNEINQITNINNLQIILDYIYYYNYHNLEYFDKKFPEFFNCLQQILKLGIEFNCDNIITLLYNWVKGNCSGTTVKSNMYFLIWWLIKNKVIAKNSNPYDQIVSQTPNISNTGFNYSVQNKAMYQECIKNFDYIFSHYNFEPNEQLLKDYAIREANFQNDKVKFIESLEKKEKEFEFKSLKLSKLEPVKKAGGKKTKKDIDV